MIGLREIQAARERIRSHIRQTPLARSPELDQRGVAVHLKLETLQQTGSFKIRGALNKILTLSPEARKKGVVAASMGNHAQGVALGAKLAGVPATIVMPSGASIMKLERTRSYGAAVIEEGVCFDDCLETARRLAEEKGLNFIPAFDDDEIIAGQGTIGLEILETLPEVDEVVVPVGGGGLIAGVAAALKESRPKVVVIGVQPEGADSAVLSFAQKRRVRVENPTTFADGVRVREVGERCLEQISKYVDRMVTVGDDEIASAVLSLMDHSKAVVEGAAATTLASIQTGQAGRPGRQTVLILSGGNIDFTQVSRILSRGLAKMGRLAQIRLLLPDIPGTLVALLGVVKKEGANVVDIEHDRVFFEGPVNTTQVRLTLETRGWDHIASVLRTMELAGYRPEKV